MKFPNPDYRLKAGEFARIRCDLGERRRQVLVDQRAVQSVQGVTSVWVIGRDSVAEYRRVELGETFGRYYFVDEGLLSGEVVALTGGQKLRNGVKVVPVKTE